jgi:hypothetical protein
VQLLRLVEGLIHEHASALGDAETSREWVFPPIPGSLVSRDNANPILEFIKTVTAVMALARDLTNEVQVLRRNLLELIGVREVRLLIFLRSIWLLTFDGSSRPRLLSKILVLLFDFRPWSANTATQLATMILPGIGTS